MHYIADMLAVITLVLSAALLVALLCTFLYALGATVYQLWKALRGFPR